MTSFSARMLPGSVPLIGLIALASVASAEPMPRVTISGFVDGSVSTTLYVGEGATGPDPVVFGVDQAEIDFDVQVTEQLRIRTDLNLFPMESSFGVDQVLEQAFFEFQSNPEGDSFVLQFGRMNAPIGVELLDPVDMYQFSYTPLFDYATPANLTGLFAGYRTGGLTVTGWLSNDWDLSSDPGDVSAGARLAYDLGAGSIGLSLMGSSLTADVSQLMADIDFGYQVGLATIWAQLNLASLLGETVDDSDTFSVGAMLKAHLAFSDAVGLTLRTTWLSRYADGANEAAGFASYQGIEATVAGVFTLTSNLAAVLELRLDKGLGDFGGGPAVVTPAFELTAFF